MKTKYFAISFSPSYYDADEIRGMELDEAKEFVREEHEKDEFCFSTFEGDINECDKLVPVGSCCDLDVLCVWFY